MRADVSERMRTKNIRNKTNYIMQIYQDIPGKKLVRSLKRQEVIFINLTGIMNVYTKERN